MDRIDRQSDSLEKEGVFTGSYCLNPFTAVRFRSGSAISSLPNTAPGAGYGRARP